MLVGQINLKKMYMVLLATFLLTLMVPFHAFADSIEFHNKLIERRADPFIYKHTDGYYYFMASVPEYDRLELRKSRTITGIKEAAPQVIWTKPATGERNGWIWAPEIHFIDGKWYVYYSASPSSDLAGGQRIYVLENASADPTTGSWVDKGRLMPDLNEFHIDGTYFENNGQKYFAWSGVGTNGNSIYMASMSNAWTVSSSRVLLTEPTLSWERVSSAVNEGPEFIKRNGKVFLTYSSDYCDANYKMGILSAPDTANLLDRASWTKSSQPIFSSNPQGNVFGPGHHSFTRSPDDTQDVIVYHAIDSSSGGCDASRSVRAQTFSWNSDGSPNLSIPVSEGTVMPPPSGENRFEAEYADSIAGLATVMSYSQASNGKDVGYLNNSSSYIQFNQVKVPAAGTYTLTIRYGNGSGKTSTHALSINGGAPITVSYPNLGSWGTFGTVKVNVDLKAGTNTLKLAYYSSYAEVDYVQVDVPSYEAEDATVNHATVLNESGASGNRKVGYVDYSDSYVEFTVNVPSAKTYTLAARYTNGSGTAATQNVTINGSAGYIMDYPNYNESWLTYRMTSIDVVLNQGVNTIRFAKGTSYAELDSITLVPTVASGSVMKLINQSSGKVADVANASTNDGADVRQWSDLNNNAQKFRFDSAGSGYYKITNVGSGKVLDVQNASTADGANVWQWSDLGNDAQKWRLVYVGLGSYKLISKNSGKALDLANADPNNGADIRQWSDNGNKAQVWVLELIP
ncbi:family 43 glycosylhydrolase [Paenibacillus hexagrammi]|uniref:Family 43 glycosylhydrolase n=1 Tax=Paenibacillus hexagrammi TaxID=2908839 RepID=A0ABY3SDI8_9BACL|nr:family 43 glycosylhydrolase [Paenibacillus sp. YPD9-1]UJF31475.1 family 43 glycosylhydrolase [Paenibacillus sp. YPD9-1]